MISGQDRMRCATGEEDGNGGGWRGEAEERQRMDCWEQPRTVLSGPAAAMPRFAETSAREGLMVIINLRCDAPAKLLTAG